METLRKIFIFFLLETAIFAAGYWASKMFSDAPHWVWLIVVATALLAAIMVWKWPVPQKVFSGSGNTTTFTLTTSKAVGSTHLPLLGRIKNAMRSFFRFFLFRKKETLEEFYPATQEAMSILEEVDFTPYQEALSENAGWDDAGADKRVPQRFYGKVIQLRHDLNKLEIDCPETNPDEEFNEMVLARKWYKFLSELAPLAKDGNLEEARTLHESLSNQREESKSLLPELKNIELAIRAYETTSASLSPKEMLHYEKLMNRAKELKGILLEMGVQNPPPGVDWITYIDLMQSDIVEDWLKNDEP